MSSSGSSLHLRWPSRPGAYGAEAGVASCARSVTHLRDALPRVLVVSLAPAVDAAKYASDLGVGPLDGQAEVHSSRCDSGAGGVAAGRARRGSVTSGAERDPKPSLAGASRAHGRLRS